MNCPKCNGEAYLSNEDVIKVLENTQPAKVIVKQIWICRSCAEKFGRSLCKHMTQLEAAASSSVPSQPTIETGTSPMETGAGIQFLDRV